MQFVDHTCSTAAENLALDELLLDEAEQGSEPREVLRLWEPREPLVVIGRSSKIAEEVNLPECARRGVPVLRRTSGGAAIVTGSGCLMYAVVLSYQQRPELRAIDVAHRFVMQRLRAGLASVGAVVEMQGTCDLTLDGCKFSGNALRCRREHCLYHGTLLYDFALPTIDELLRMPPRMPEYRAERPHRTFVSNLPLSRAALRAAVQQAFLTEGVYQSWDTAALRLLAQEKFDNPEWNAKL